MTTSDERLAEIRELSKWTKHPREVTRKDLSDCLHKVDALMRQNKALAAQLDKAIQEKTDVVIELAQIRTAGLAARELQGTTAWTENDLRAFFALAEAMRKIHDPINPSLAARVAVAYMRANANQLAPDGLAAEWHRKYDKLVVDVQKLRAELWEARSFVIQYGAQYEVARVERVLEETEPSAPAEPGGALH